ncbi:hypothetical protein LTS18_008535, partial [Coniosporium uncinatum]
NTLDSSFSLIYELEYDPNIDPRLYQDSRVQDHRSSTDGIPFEGPELPFPPAQGLNSIPAFSEPETNAQQTQTIAVHSSSQSIELPTASHPPSPVDICRQPDSFTGPQLPNPSGASSTDDAASTEDQLPCTECKKKTDTRSWKRHEEFHYPQVE